MTSQILKRAHFAAIVAMTAAVLLVTGTMAASFRYGGDSTVLPLAGGGETITVTTLDDVSDFSGLQPTVDILLASVARMIVPGTGQ